MDFATRAEIKFVCAILLPDFRIPYYMDNKRFNVFQEFEQGHFSPAFGFKKDIFGFFRIEYFEMENRYALFPIEIKEQDKQIIDIPSAEVSMSFIGIKKINHLILL